VETSWEFPTAIEPVWFEESAASNNTVSYPGENNAKSDRDRIGRSSQNWVENQSRNRLIEFPPTLESAIGWSGIYPSKAGRPLKAVSLDIRLAAFELGAC
jgi:hypothetical protein